MRMREMMGVFVAVAVALWTGDAKAQPEFFRAHLSGGEEVPPVATNAQGQANFQLSGDGLTLRFQLNVANIVGITQSHIHCGAAGTNGPVVVFLFGFIGTGVDVNGVLARGTASGANVIPRPDSAACPGGVETLDDLIDKMRTGDAYVNVHTLGNPGGEVRGQIR